MKHPSPKARIVFKSFPIDLQGLTALLLGCLLAPLLSCSSGGGSSSNTGSQTPPSSYTVGGTITGLTGSGLVLQDNGGNNLSVSAGATTFSFSTALVSGSAYSVTVLTQPANPTQNCTVSSGSGAVGNANITSVQVNCSSGSSTPTLSSIVVTPAAFAVAIGHSQQFAATGLFSDGSTQDLTGSSSWTSSATSVATVSPTTAGLTTGVGAGSTTIVATYGSIQGSTSLKVATALPRFSYVGNGNLGYNATISTYTANPVTGQLRPTGYEVQELGSAPLIVDPSGKFAYAAENGGPGADYAGDILGYAINASNGILTPIPGSPLGASGTQSLIVDPSDKFVYAAEGPPDNPTGALSFLINQTTGTLTQVTGAPFVQTQASDCPATATSAAQISPVSINVDSLDKFVYITNTCPDNSVTAFAINPNTGVLTAVPGSPFALFSGNCLGSGGGAFALNQSVAIDPSTDSLYVVDNCYSEIAAFTINESTGALTPVPGSPFQVGASPTSITIDPTGRFAYVTDASGISAFAINVSSGVLTAISGSPFEVSPPSVLTIDSAGKFLYTWNESTISAFTIDQSTGTLTTISVYTPPRQGADLPYGALRVDPTDSFLYVQGMTYSIDPGSGALTLVDVASDGLEGGGLSFTLTEGVAAPLYVPQFAYVANSSSNNISAYSVNAATGTLTAVAGSPFPTGANPTGTAVDATGRFLYVANHGSDTVGAYTIDADTGALTAIPGSPYPGGSEPLGVTIDPSGNFLYVTNSGSDDLSIFAIDAATGALTPSTSTLPTGGDPGFLAPNPAGFILYVPNFSSNNVTSFLVPPGAAPNGESNTQISSATNPDAVAVDLSGRFVYVADYTSGTISANSVPGSPFVTGTNPESVTVDPSNRFVYVANEGSNTVSAFTINVSTGALTPVEGSPFAAGTGPTWVAVDPSGSFVYVTNSGSNNVSVFTINPTTGALTPILGSPFPAGTGPATIAISGTIQ